MKGIKFSDLCDKIKKENALIGFSENIFDNQKYDHFLHDHIFDYHGLQTLIYYFEIYANKFHSMIPLGISINIPPHTYTIDQLIDENNRIINCLKSSLESLDPVISEIPD